MLCERSRVEVASALRTFHPGRGHIKCGSLLKDVLPMGATDFNQFPQSLAHTNVAAANPLDDRHHLKAESNVPDL